MIICKYKKNKNLQCRNCRSRHIGSRNILRYTSGMRKIFLLLSLIFILNAQIVFADEEQTVEDIDQYFVDEQEQSTELHGYLEYNKNQEQEDNSIQLEGPTVYRSVNLSKPKGVETKSFFTDSQKPTFTPLENNLNAASKFSTEEYSINPISSSYSKKFGKFSFGTMYGSYLNSAQMNYSTGLFAKYEGKHFALGTGFSKSANNNYDAYNENFYVAPELKLTKRLSIMDVIETDAGQINKSNELVLRYTPHFKKFADEVQFEVGAGQSYYEDNFVKSSLRFATRFKL